MALYKGNKEEVQSRQALVRKTAIFRPGDFSDGAFVEQPLSPPEVKTKVEVKSPEPVDTPETVAPFEEGLPAAVPPPQVFGKVLGGRQPVSASPSKPLPAFTQTILIPHGAEPKVEARGNGAPESAPMAPQPVGPPIDQAIIEEAQRRANQLVQEAQSAANQMLVEYQMQAQKMMEQANQQIQAAAEQVQRQAHEMGMQNGYQEGLQAGTQAAQQQLSQLMLQVRDIYVQAIKQRQWLLASAEPELARLAMKVAEKILGQEIQSNPEAIVGIVRAALSGLGDREEVAIRVNPADYEAARAQKSVFERMVEGLKKFEIVADQAIDQGGCSIETNLGNVDARLNTQIAVLSLAMEEQAKAHELEIKEEIEVQTARMMQEGGG